MRNIRKLAILSMAIITMSFCCSCGNSTYKQMSDLLDDLVELEENKLAKGEVYDKEFRQGYSYVSSNPITTTVGGIIITNSNPSIHHIPDRWVISIRELNVSTQEYVKADYFVSEEEYNSIEIGSFYDSKKGTIATNEESHYKEEK